MPMDHSPCWVTHQDWWYSQNHCVIRINLRWWFHVIYSLISVYKYSFDPRKPCLTVSCQNIQCIVYADGFIPLRIPHAFSCSLGRFLASDLLRSFCTFPGKLLISLTSTSLLTDTGCALHVLISTDSFSSCPDKPRVRFPFQSDSTPKGDMDPLMLHTLSGTGEGYCLFSAWIRNFFSLIYYNVFCKVWCTLVWW